MSISNVKEIVCPHCKNTFHKDVMEGAGEPSVDEREMGNELGYDIELTGKCPKCGHQFRIVGIVCEYPEDMLNYEDLDISWFPAEKK